MIHFKSAFQKIIISLAAVCGFQFVAAQNYPAFSVTAYDSASSGYYFIVPIRTASTNNPIHMILDSLGRVVYYKRILNTVSGDFKIQPNGLMSYSRGSQFYLMDSTFTIVDSVRCQGYSTDTHDMQVLANGHFLVMGFEYQTMDLSMYNYFGPNNTLPGSANASVKFVVIQEQDASHNVVFEWRSKNYFAVTDVDPRFLGSPVNVDLTHSNSVELDTDGNILLSSRHFNEVTKINRTDSSIIWRLGGNANQFTFINDTFPFRGQHDARRIANGNLTLNDNGHASGPDHYAAAKEYLLDENLHTATLVWSYVEDTTSYSIAFGSCQRLTNGNTVVDYGNTPHSNIMFNVVDPAGNKIFELTFHDTLRSYRAFNYLTLPWSLTRPQISCYMVSSQLYLDAGSGYGRYLWSTGDTTQVIAVTAADTFSVFVPNGHGGFISSDFIAIPNPATYCLTSTTGDMSNSSAFEIFPNPVSNELRIELLPSPVQNYSVRIIDAFGKCVFADQYTNTNRNLTVPVADLSPGVYYILVNGAGKKFVKL
jgi:hypothetical protein